MVFSSNLSRYFWILYRIESTPQRVKADQTQVSTVSRITTKTRTVQHPKRLGLRTPQWRYRFIHQHRLLDMLAFNRKGKLKHQVTIRRGLPLQCLSQRHHLWFNGDTDDNVTNDESTLRETQNTVTQPVPTRTAAPQRLYLN